MRTCGWEKIKKKYHSFLYRSYVRMYAHATKLLFWVNYSLIWVQACQICLVCIKLANKSKIAWKKKKKINREYESVHRNKWKSLNVAYWFNIFLNIISIIIKIIGSGSKYEETLETTIRTNLKKLKILD